MKRNNVLTSESLYDIVKESKEKDKRVVMKADRNILLRLITAYESVSGMAILASAELSGESTQEIHQILHWNELETNLDLLLI